MTSLRCENKRRYKGISCKHWVNVYTRDALNLYLYALVMDELANSIKNEVQLCMQSADDIVLIPQSFKEIN